MIRRGEAEISSRNGWSQDGNDNFPRRPNGEQQSSSSSDWHPSPPQLSNRPVPGRPRKRMPVIVTPPISGEILGSSSRRKQRKNFCSRFLAQFSSGKTRTEGFSSLVLLAIVLWYLLGVISIGTSKLLLMKPKTHQLVGNVPPVFLTLQQLIIGSLLFRFLLHNKALGSSGLQPWPTSSSKKARRPSQKSKQPPGKSSELVLTGLFFGLGFLTTNYSFRHSSAAFVETIKAAEPITSALVAVTWGIETLGINEVISLGAIVMGVLISTVANGSAGTPSDSSSSTLSASIGGCLLIMVTNVCFSFRGLHQKLFRASPQGTVADVDDLNLQYRVQQVGVALLIIPVIVLDGVNMFSRVWHIYWNFGFFQSGALLRYIGLSLVNGLAFASYNLASTFVLSRISVVHHAALNCIRRIFAIIVTSIAFGLPITWFGAFGILVSFWGFMSFTHFKAKRHSQPRQVSTLLPMSAV